MTPLNTNELVNNKWGGCIRRGRLDPLLIFKISFFKTYKSETYLELLKIIVKFFNIKKTTLHKKYDTLLPQPRFEMKIFIHLCDWGLIFNTIYNAKNWKYFQLHVVATINCIRNEQSKAKNVVNFQSPATKNCGHL